MAEPANYINHVVFVLDRSTSMRHLQSELIKVVDNQVAYLAQRSKDLDQETRVTIYSFGNGPATCLVYDKDVLRLPSIASLYKIQGMTALIDATWLAVDDLSMTPEKYGEHSFLVYVLTDGQENSSHNRPAALSGKINALPDHWTLAVFVPDQVAVHEVKRFGFPANNVAVWDATSNAGVVEVGETIRRTTETFMQNRTRGIRGSKNLFSLNEVSPADVKVNLTPLLPNMYSMYNVDYDSRIDDFVTNKRGIYKIGQGYYQLTKAETVQPQKEICILTGNKVYRGSAARSMLGLPNISVRVAPENHPGYTVFVQSTSVNRKLIAGTRLLVLG